MGTESDKEAVFSNIYNDNVESVYWTVTHYVKDCHAVEEITQNVFMTFYMNMDGINLAAAPAWLAITARNMALNYTRDSKHEIVTEDLSEDHHGLIQNSVEDSMIQKLQTKEYKELKEEVFAALYRTNISWYTAVTMAYVLRKPQKQVAEDMGISIDALRSMLLRAKKWIRKNYEEQFRQIEHK